MSVFGLFVENRLIVKCVGLNLFLDLYPAPWLSVPVFMQAPCCTAYSGMKHILKVRDQNASGSVHFVQACFGTLGLFVLPYKLQTFLFFLLPFSPFLVL